MKVQEALKAANKWFDDGLPSHDMPTVITAIKSALSELEKCEPVAWRMQTHPRGDYIIQKHKPDSARRDLWEALYTSPQPIEKCEPVAWRDVVGFEGLYEVSSTGDVKNKITQRIQAKNVIGTGYIKADLWKDGKRTQTSVHRVVAEAFLEKGSNKEVNHINGIKSDNRVENLEWSNRVDNMNHSFYSLGNNVKPIIATNIDTNEEKEYPSICSATRDGFTSAAIHACLAGRVTRHKRFTFRYKLKQLNAPKE